MEKITNWASGVIVAVIIATLIEMILPENKNKKYIKTVIGFYVLFTILSPIISNALTNGEIDISKYEKYFESSEETNSLIEEFEMDNDTNIYTIYKTQLEEDIKLKIKNKGYKVKSMDLTIKEKEENYGEIENIKMSIEVLESSETEETKDNNQISEININKIEIGKTIEQKQEKSKVELTQKQEDEIKQYLKEEYGVKKENIILQ